MWLATSALPMSDEKPSQGPTVCLQAGQADWALGTATFFSHTALGAWPCFLTLHLLHFNFCILCGFHLASEWNLTLGQKNLCWQQLETHLS